MIRSNHKFELMAIVTIHPQDLKEEEIRSEMERMKDYLLASPVGKQLVSIYYQCSQHTRATAEQCLNHSWLQNSYADIVDVKI